MRARVRDMPLFRKLLLPYLTLVLLVAVSGAVIVVRDMSARTQSVLDQQLSRALIDARSAIHDRELYVLESANFAANESGMASAAQHDRANEVGTLLRSVLALKRDLDVLAVVGPDGRRLAVFDRATGTRLRSGGRVAWAAEPLVRAARASRDGSGLAGVLTIGSRHFLAVATPVCGSRASCVGAPLAVAGIDTHSVVAAARMAGDHLTLFSRGGQVLAATGIAPARPQALRGNGLVRIRSTVGGVDTETLYGDLSAQGGPAAVLAVTQPVHAAFSSARGTAYRLALLIALAMLGVILIGAVLSRAILGQVHSLLRTSQALGAGDLDARATVRGQDEIGQLAAGVNEMAERLQAAVQTLESQAEQTAEEVKRLLADRTEFFAGMSHEFRTPLAVIRAQVDLLLERRHGNDKATRETLLTMRLAAGQVLELVNEVLELSRTEAGRIEVDLQEVALSDVTRELRPIVAGLAGGADVRWSLDVPRDLPHVAADPRRLREVLLNLVDNAVKYTSAGGSVRVSARADGDDVEMLVADTGVGIPAEALAHLFEPFYRAPGVQTQRGQRSTGLGLALTRRLVDAMGGDIECESTEGAGTTMRLRLRQWAADVAGSSLDPVADAVAPDDARELDGAAAGAPA